MNMLTPEARAQIVKFYAQHKDGWVILDSGGNFRTVESPHTISDLEVLALALNDTDMVNYRVCNVYGAMNMIFGADG
ncbi:MAG: hypothetical protein JWP09_160 [Candidatus Taylorbacteria bacterium]|nr:hypothetical protein [Candidatus Taylorbacteria bacterium]